MERQLLIEEFIADLACYEGITNFYLNVSEECANEDQWLALEANRKGLSEQMQQNYDGLAQDPTERLQQLADIFYNDIRTMMGQDKE